MSLGALIYHDCCHKQCGWLWLSVQLSRPEGFKVNIQLKLDELFREVMLSKKSALTAVSIRVTDHLINIVLNGNRSQPISAEE